MKSEIIKRALQAIITILLITAAILLYKRPICGAICLLASLVALTALNDNISSHSQKNKRRLNAIENENIENKKILKAVQNGILIFETETQQIRFCNPLAASWAMMEQEEILGQPVTNFIEEEDHTRVNLGHPNAFDEKLLKRSNTAPLDILISFSQILYKEVPCTIASFQNISSIKQKKKEAAESAKYLIQSRDALISMMEDTEISKKALIATNEEMTLIKQAVDSSSDAIAVISAFGTIVYQNNTFIEMFGYSPERIRYLNPEDLFVKTKTNPKQLQKLFGLAKWKGEALMQRLDGSTFPAQISLNKIKDSAEETVGVILAFDDITERKQNEKIQQEYICELKHSKSLSESMMKAAEAAKKETEKISQDLAKSEQRYRAIVNDQQEFIGRCDIDYTISFTNKMFAILCPQKEKKYNLWTIWPEELKTQYRTQLTALKYKGGSMNVEFMLTLPNATERWTIWSITALKNEQGKTVEYQIVGRDEHRRHLAEKELLEHRKHLSKLVEDKTEELATANKQLAANLATQKTIASRNMLLARIIQQSDDMIIVTDHLGRELFSNQSYKKFYPTGKNYKCGGLYQPILDHIRKQNTWSGVTTFCDDEKNEFLLDCRIFPVFDDFEKLLAIACTQRDITARARLETQLRQAQKMQAIGTLAGGIAHDFNNLLMSISGFAKLAHKKVESNPKASKYLENIMKAGERGRQLVSQLMKFGRPEELIASPKDDIMNLGDLIEEVATLISSTLPSTISIHKSFHSKALVRLNSSQIHQVLVNLCTNSNHAMNGEGQLHLIVEDMHFTPETYADAGLQKEGDYTCIRVRDTGCGIPPENLQRIFEPFYTTKEIGIGNGMGLAIAHGIIQEHGGNLFVKSTVGIGTEFFIYLPQENTKDQKNTLIAAHE